MPMVSNNINTLKARASRPPIRFQPPFGLSMSHIPFTEFFPALLNRQDYRIDYIISHLLLHNPLLCRLVQQAPSIIPLTKSARHHGRSLTRCIYLNEADTL
jgi:hypothetical protein